MSALIKLAVGFDNARYRAATALRAAEEVTVDTVAYVVHRVARLPALRRHCGQSRAQFALFCHWCMLLFTDMLRPARRIARLVHANAIPRIAASRELRPSAVASTTLDLNVCRGGLMEPSLETASYAARPKSISKARYFLVALVLILIGEALRRIPYRRVAVLALNFRYVLSLALHKLRCPPTPSETVVRSNFNSLPVARSKPPTGHSHGSAAAERSDVTAFMHFYAETIGLELYLYQQSPTDQRRGSAGSRDYHLCKDLSTKPALMDPHPRSIIGVVDVDMYVDMPRWCVDYYRPMLIYTPVPSVAARGSGEIAFTFDANNCLVTTVAGGAKYVHPLWDYGPDTIVARTAFRTNVFKTDRKTISHHHMLVLLTPIASFGVLGGILASYIAPGPVLRRLSPTSGGFISLVTQDAEGMKLSIARVGAYNVATISMADYDALKSTVAVSRHALTTPAVQTLTRCSQAEAVLINEYIRSACPLPEARVYPVAPLVEYQFKPGHHIADAEPIITSFMNPILENAAFVPVDAPSTAETSVKERCLDLRNETQRVTGFMREMMRDFAKAIRPDVLLFPEDHEDVLDKQCRPSQRAILENANFEEPPDAVVAFVKREPHTSVKAPRIISTVPGRLKWDYSCFMYSLADHIKNYHWYAFGKTACDVAMRVAAICAEAQSVSLTDYSRMDGRMNPALREFERLCLATCFDPSVVEEVLELHRRQQNLPARCQHVTWDTGSQRLSGSPETSIMNTLVNVFLAYCMFRKTGHNHDVAMLSLGIYGGDDGLTPNAVDTDYSRVATWFGMVLETKTLRRGDRGVQFLSRVYSPDVWFGDPDSMSVFRRMAAGFTLCCRMPPHVTPVMKLVEKARSRAVNDAKTPLMGFLLERVAALAQGVTTDVSDEERRQLASYWSVTEQPYPNTGREWMCDQVEAEIPGILGVAKTWLEAVESATTLEELLALPPLWTFDLPTSTKHVVVADQPVPDPEPAGPPESVVNLPSTEPDKGKAKVKDESKKKQKTKDSGRGKNRPAAPTPGQVGRGRGGAAARGGPKRAPRAQN